MPGIKPYTKKDGSKAYMFQTYLGIDPTGKEKRTTRRGFKTEKEAKLALARLQLDIDKNGFNGLSDIKTFQDLYDVWIEEYKHTIKPTTYKRVVGIFDKYVLPAMGKLQLKKIKTSIAQKVFNNWADKFSYKTVILFRTYMKIMFKYAVRMDICDSNPVDNVIVRKKEPENPKDGDNNAFYTKNELKYFFECLEQIEDLRQLALFRVLAFTGARKGEVLALTWSDISFEQKTLTINKTLVKLKEGFAIQTPKTKKSIRTITLDPETISILRRWKVNQGGYDIIFSSVEGGYLYVDYPNHCLRMIYKQNPLLKRIKIHGFRHTHASLLFESGADIKVVQQRLGHSDIKTTMNIYTHVSLEHERNTGLQFAKYVDF